MKIGDNIIVESLLNDDFAILHPDTTVVVQVKTARAAIVEEVEEEEGDYWEGPARDHGDQWAERETRQPEQTQAADEDEGGDAEHVQ